MSWPLFRFQGRNFFVGILVQTMTTKGHFEINWPLIFTSNFKDWWVMMKKTQAQWIPCLYQWWKTMGILDHKPTKIMWTKEFILRQRHNWNQDFVYCIFVHLKTLSIQIYVSLKRMVHSIAIKVVEFSNREYKIRKVFA